MGKELQTELFGTGKRSNFDLPQEFYGLKPTEVFGAYWNFAYLRQEIFYSRILGRQPETAQDEILAKHKFTNAYRASDRTSQFLIKNVIYADERDVNDMFFRVILFKLFNRIETWELFAQQLGEVSYSNFSIDRYGEILTQAIQAGEKIYSAAYIMPSGGKGYRYAKKHLMHLHLLEAMMKDGLAKKLARCKSMKDAFLLLRSYPTIGNFLAYQYITDLSYSPHYGFSEMEFVQAGPGALDGISKCFSNANKFSPEYIIEMMARHQDDEFSRLNLNFSDLWGRKLQLIDCQNLFCEISKYARLAYPDVVGTTGRTRIKQIYRASKKPLSPWYPPKWGINEELERKTECSLI